MSLMKAFAKVAAGIAIAKGVQMYSQRDKTSTDGTHDAEHTRRSEHTQQSEGGLKGMLGNLMGGSGASGGLGGMLDKLGGGQIGGQGGLAGMLGGLAGAGGAGGLLGGIAGALGGKQAPEEADAGAPNTESFGTVLNSQFDDTPEEPIEPDAGQEQIAAVLLRAMVQASKADGEISQAEREKLLARVKEAGAEAERYVRDQMNAPVDTKSLADDVPEGMAPQVYAVSLMAINLDNQAEAQHLHNLAQSLGLDEQRVNSIHEQLGVPSLYT